MRVACGDQERAGLAGTESGRKRSGQTESDVLYLTESADQDVLGDH